MNVKFIHHIFVPHQTITAVIKYYNHYVDDHATVELLLNMFNEANNNEIPRPGVPFKIPTIVRDNN